MVKNPWAALALTAAVAAGFPAAWAAPVQLGPNLVVNGGFETGDFSGWTLSGNTDFLGVDCDPAHAHGGNCSVAGGPVGATGSINQTIPTIVGHDYNISLWLANFSGEANEINSIVISWGGKAFFSAIDIPKSGYQEISIDPVATSTAMLLSVTVRDDAGFLQLDDFEVREKIVPEPSSVALVLSAMVMLLRSRRLQNQ